MTDARARPWVVAVTCVGVRARALALAIVLGALCPRLGHAADAEAKPARRALFALIVGVNNSMDRDQEALRYADDDAARYLALFRSLGARATVLARLDENTRRLHPQAAAEAELPTGEAFAKATATLVQDVAQAQKRGLEAVFYFVYAGHGRIRGNEGYLALEDARLGEVEIRRVIEAVGAAEVHLIVDACHADFLAYGRGPGGRRRPAEGFVLAADLVRDGRIGLFLSTSSTGESHEWEGLQAGVFSHEVRSGLYGAADVDGDGRVSYRELGAFVSRANAAIVNERYRPQVVVRPPRVTDQVLDLRPALGRSLRLDGTEESAHHTLEDERGVRVLDFHNARGQRLAIIRPAADGRLFLRRPADRVEFTIPASEETVTLSALTPSPSPDGTRGAAHQAFSTLFALPFDQNAVDQLLIADDDADRGARGGPSALGVGAATVAVAGLVAGFALHAAAGKVRDDLPSDASGADKERANQDITTRNRLSALGYGVGAAAGLAAIYWLFVAPPTSSSLTAQVSPEGVGLGWRGRF